MIEPNTIYHGDCLAVLKTFKDNSFDSCVTDPPYGISFMNKHWDYDVPSIEVWKEILRVLKPGGYLLCACGTRTQHRMAVNIEDAGLEIRDVITWHYGSGFPKSLDISKQLDKQAGVEREVIKTINKAHISQRNTNDGWHRPSHLNDDGSFKTTMDITEPKSDEAKEWNGWGTALKPATEFWTLARKPLSENTVAANVLKHGTGGINIDGSRIELQKGDDSRLGGNGTWSSDKMAKNVYEGGYEGKEVGSSPLGRFPANVIFDEFTGKILDEQSGLSRSTPHSHNHKQTTLIYGGGNGLGIREGDSLFDDVGGASRFFYCPKADNFERNKGLNGFDASQNVDHRYGRYRCLKCGKLKLDHNPCKCDEPDFVRIETNKGNNHPTVKPIDLMRYLVKLITPKKGICLDPYCGSGTTLIGCKLELVNYIGIETNEEYCKIAEARISAWNPEKYIPQTLF